MASEKSKGIPALTRVKSSSIAEVGHEDDTMYVRFAAGSLYRFPGISAKQYQDALAAKSIGSHVSNFIIQKVKGIPVREE